MKRVLACLMALLLLSGSAAFALKAGDSGAEVTRLQDRLHVLGFLEDAADGQYGTQTTKGVRRVRNYLAQMGINAGNEEDGAADDALIKALFASDFPVTGEEMSVGVQSNLVFRVQTRLRSLKYLSDLADGVYGENTARAVAVLQKKAGLPVTGNADVLTQQALFREDAPVAEYAPLYKGRFGQAVIDLQTRLAFLGFYQERITGKFDTATVQAIKALQGYFSQSARYAGKLEDALRSIEFSGVADTLMQEMLYAVDFPVVPEALKPDSEGVEVRRLQTRLGYLGYLNAERDGGYGADTEQAVEAFQARNGLKADGAAGEKTMQALFSEKAREAQKPFLIRVNRKEQRVYLYAPDEKEEYTILKYTMACSTGKADTPTAAGDYSDSTGPGAQWKAEKDENYFVRYPFNVAGKIVIHSIPYDAKEGLPMNRYSETLGTPQTAGSIMLSVENAKLIWDKCPRGTRVVIE